MINTERAVSSMTPQVPFLSKNIPVLHSNLVVKDQMENVHVNTVKLLKQL